MNKPPLWLWMRCVCVCVMRAMMDRTDRRWAGPRPCSLTPLCQDPVLSCCLATFADPGAWVRPASLNDVDRTALEASRVCFQGTNLSFCCFLSLNTLSTPEAVFSSTYGDLSPSAAAIVENVAKREINIFENIWIHMLSFPNFLDSFL